MDISIPAVIAQTLNFLVLFFLFRKYLTKPILKVVEDRRELIKKVENADVAYNEKIQQAREEADDLIREGKMKKENIIAEAGILADKKQHEIISYAKDQAEKTITEANVKIDSLERELETKFEDSVKHASLLVLKKLIKKDKTIQDDYVREVINELKN